MDLSKWSVFNKLESDFKSTIRYAFVFGNDRDEAIVITDSDEVYGMGTNKKGCLGIGTSESTLQPKKIDVLCGKRIKSLACGYGPYVVALTEAGQIYTWGDNSNGKLGYEGVNCSTTPNLIADVTDLIFAKIACGGRHSLAVTDNGKVYGWGYNYYKQINYGPSEYCHKPQQVTTVIGSERIKTVACTRFSSFAVTHSGKVYGWGSNEYGELCVQSNSPSQPITIRGLDDLVIVKIVCGSLQVLALTHCGKIFSWGSNGCGQLGLGHTNTTYKASVVNIERAADVIASPLSYMSAAVLLNGSVFVWGLFQVTNLLLPTLKPFKSLLDVVEHFPMGTFSMYDILPVKNSDEPSTSEMLSVTKSLIYAFNNSVNCDVTFVVEEKKIHAHKTVLMLRSKFFSTMFNNDWRETCTSLMMLKVYYVRKVLTDKPLLSEDIVDQVFTSSQVPSELPDCLNELGCQLVIEKYSYSLYRAFLYYLYSGKLEIEDKCLIGMLELSDYYMADNLKKACTRKIKNTITLENALDVYKAAVSYNNEELKELALKFSVDHMTSLVLSEKFRSLDLEMTRDFIESATKKGAFKK